MGLIPHLAALANEGLSQIQADSYIGTQFQADSYIGRVGYGFNAL